MKKYVIGIDADDTIHYLLEGWVAYLNNKHGTCVNKEDVRQWDVSESFPMLTRAEVYEPLNDDEFWKTLRPMDDAVKYVKQLIDDGHDVYICTASHYATIKSKMENLLFKYFPYLHWNQVIICAKKQLLRFDYLIDDGLHNIIGNYKGLLMDTPHNRHVNFDENSGVTRVHNWEEIYSIITKDACN